MPTLRNRLRNNGSVFTTRFKAVYYDYEIANAVMCVSCGRRIDCALGMSVSMLGLVTNTAASVGVNAVFASDRCSFPKNTDQR